MSSRITQKLWSQIRHVRAPAPDGWLTISEFAERAGGMLVQQIYKGIESGKISRKHLAILEDSGGQPKILIDWDSAAYNFIASRRPAYRPVDFLENEAHVYKPFVKRPQQSVVEQQDREMERIVIADITGDGSAEMEDLTIEQQRIVNHRLVTMKVNVPIPHDATTAKYVKELLEIEKRQIELRKEANELIDTETERSMLAGIAAQLNGNASKAIPKWSPIFAAEDDPRVIRQLMKQMFADILKPVDVDKNANTEN